MLVFTTGRRPTSSQTYTSSFARFHEHLNMCATKKSSESLRRRSKKPTIDEDAGNKFNNKKSTVATSLMSEQKNIMKIATRQKLKHVTSDKQVGYQLSQGKQRNREVQNERATKATITINRIYTIRNIYTFEQREHLVMSAGTTQYVFGVEAGVER